MEEISDVIRKQRRFYNSERQIVDYILKNPTNIQNLTATELGSNSYTSEATVLRLCQKLDLSGYSDLRMTLIKEISEKDRLNQRRNGIHIIRISGRKSVTLKEICHEYIVIDDKNHVFNIESIGTYTAMILVLDVMYLDLMSKNYEENLTSSIEVYKDH
ncbi:MurR/RpiR family transcriptional regulator [Aerococcus urinaeequi]|uniref:MurR/RpiR family transcriptional regulator n=1 Tax=Aerococcus urinaeequi TaxID=51665 RepID=UPI0039BCBED2